jgi:hypothetical protein
MKLFLTILFTLPGAWGSMTGKADHIFTAKCYISRCQKSSGCESPETTQFENCVQRLLRNLALNQCEASIDSQTTSTLQKNFEKYSLIETVSIKTNCPIMSRGSNQLCPNGTYSSNINSDLKVCGPPAIN